MKKRILVLLLAFILLLGALSGCSAAPAPQSTQSTVSAEAASDGLTVHYIDVGQADSILLQCGGKTMLIDGGNVADSDLVVSYLLNQNIENLDYVVSTHAHEDHVGGLAGVLAVFPVGAVYSPVTWYNSKAFDNFAKYADQQDLTLQKPEPGSQLSLGETTVTFLGPVAEYPDVNNTSIVLRADFGSTSFLFTGDAEAQAEQDIMNYGADVKADVLKVGHHGSSSSTCDDFLKAVSPSSAVISCGKDNDYGHPHKETLSRLSAAAIALYRTDLQGHIIAKSDGTAITFTTEKHSSQQSSGTSQAETEPAAEVCYIGNRNSKKFHLPTCTGLPAEENRVTFSSYQEAIDAGYSPCGICKPQP